MQPTRKTVYPDGIPPVDPQHYALPKAGTIPSAPRLKEPDTRHYYNRHNIVASDELTPQERNIALLVSEGLTNTEIAARLYIAPGTTRNYVSVILAKLQLPNRAALAAYAVQHDLQAAITAEYETPTISDPDCYREFAYMAYV